jgi:superfamily II DNA or RNA helicase
MWAPGTRLRIVGDAGRIGVFSGEQRERGPRLYLRVSFPDGVQWIPADQLEPELEGEAPIDLLRRGRLARPADLYRALTHVRLAGRLSNFIYSLGTTNTEFYAYQFKPVLKLLQSVSTGILVADEVGLGKTIEAGLIWTELKSRFDLQRLLVVCPAMLRDKWVKELRRFGVRAEKCDAAEVLAHLEEAASGGHQEFALVASMQGLRPPPGWIDEEDAPSVRARLARLLHGRAQDGPLVDLLVVDEAHYLRNPETRTSELGTVLRRASQFAVLLSATPVHLKSADLFTLLRVVDEDIFTDSGTFELVRRANEHLIGAREAVASNSVDAGGLADLLSAALREPLLSGNRQLSGLMAEVGQGLALDTPAQRSEIAARLEGANLFGFAISRTRRREVKEWRAVRDAATLTVTMNALERRVYDEVTETVRRYCAQSDALEGFLLVMPQRQMSSCMAASVVSWLGADNDLAGALYEEFGLDEGDGESRALGPVVAEIRSRLGELGDIKALAQDDTKYQRLRDELRSFRAEHPGEKIIVFSTFRATLRYLAACLRRDRIPVALLLGGDPDQQNVLASFARRDGPSVLLSSEVGAEGIDLQFAWMLVNYDLPWNPMRVEQRIGRIDRLGQRSPKVVVWNLIHDQTIDQRIYQRLLLRLGIFERTLGGLEVVIGEQFAMLARDLMRQHLTPAQEEARIDQTALALENVRRNEEALEQEAASLVAYGDYILRQIYEARDLSRQLHAADLQRYVLDLLTTQFPGTRIVQDAVEPAEVTIDLSVDARVAFGQFLRARRAGSSKLAHGHGATRCRFDNSQGADAPPGGEIISQVHPVVRFLAQVADEKRLIVRPAVAAQLSRAAVQGVTAGDYVFAVTHWVFEAIRPLERLTFGVESVDGARRLDDTVAERLVMAMLDGGTDWAEGANVLDGGSLADRLEQGLLVAAQDRFEEETARVRAENADRADAQLRGIEAHLAHQEERFALQRERHLAAGNPGLARAQELAVDKLRARIARQREAIEAKRGVRAEFRELSVGLVRVV